MNSALLLVTVLLLSTGSMFAQQVNIHQPDSSTQEQISQTASADATYNVLGASRSLPLNASIDPMMVTSDNRSVDNVCYTMRSYVVARDTKHSDSVHPVGYSTCQPGSKYRLRTTELTTTPAQR